MYICYPTNLDEYLKKQFKEEEKDFALLCKQIYYLFEKVLMYCHPSFNHLNNNNHNNHLNNNNNLNNSLQNMTQKSIMVLKNDKLNTLTLYFFFILDYNKLYNEYQLQFTKRNELTNITVAITLQYLSTTNNYNHNNYNNNHNNNELTTKKGQYNTEEENNQLDDETLQSLLKHTQIKEGMNVKEFCEYYIKIMNSNNKISKRILKVFKEINNSKFDGNFKIKVFKNCTIVPRFDDSFIICKNILSVCKLGLFDKNAKKGLNLEQLEYLKGLRPDKPFFTLLERMESLQREIIIPLFQFMIYCHRYLNCTIYHLLLKDFIFFKLNSFTTISNNNNSNNNIIINNNNNCNNKTNKTRKIIVNNDTKNGNNSDNNSSSSPSCLLSAFTTMTCGSSSSSSPTSSTSSPVLSTSTFCGEIDSNNNNINNNLIVKESKEEEEDCNNTNCKEEEEEEKDSLIIEKIIERKEVIFIMSSLCKKMELNNRSLLIQTDIFQLAILFLEFITGTNPQNVCLTNNEEVNDYVSGMLKQLHCSIDYLRQTSIQFENSLFSKPINDQHKVKLMCERFAHLQTLLFCLSNFEKMITEMIEYKTHAFKDLFCLFDAKKMQEMIENTCDCLFKEKIEGCQIVKQTKEIISLQPIQLKVSVKQFHQEKKRQLEEKSRNILSNVNNNNCQPNFISRPPLSDITNNQQQQNKTLLENNSAFDDCSPNIVGESKQLKRKFNSSSQQKDGRLKVQKSATTATLLLNNVAASSNHNKVSHHHAVKQQDKEN